MKKSARIELITDYKAGVWVTLTLKVFRDMLNL